jgi:NADH:ubiquinone oxidoreductase subunit C
MSHPGDFLVFCRDQLGIEEVPPEGPMVPREQLVAFATRLKEELDYRYFVTVVSVHYPAVEAVPADEESGTEAVPGKPDCTQVCYRVRRLPSDGRETSVVPFRVFVPTEESTPSLSGVWAGADWQEREQYDLVGTIFSDHPDLRRIMLPEDWVGHPLRRDYAIDTSHFPWR